MIGCGDGSPKTDSVEPTKTTASEKDTTNEMDKPIVGKDNSNAEKDSSAAGKDSPATGKDNSTTGKDNTNIAPKDTSPTVNNQPSAFEVPVTITLTYNHQTNTGQITAK